MLSVETSRWAEFFGGRLTNTVFPKRITVTEEGIKTVKVRSLVVPWMREEEAMPFGKIASVRHLKGIIWDTLVFETSGGRRPPKGRCQKDHSGFEWAGLSRVCGHCV